MKEWKSDKILTTENPLTPVEAENVLSKEYNAGRTVNSFEWLEKRAVPDNIAAETDKLHKGFLNTALKINLSENHAGAIWDRILPFMENPEFVGFVKDTHTIESEFFFSWLSCVPRAITLEAHFGYAPDLKGSFREVPKTDPFWYWTKTDPGLNLVGYRFKRTQNYLADKENILELASGWFQWLRHGNYQPAVDRQYIYSCDLDPEAHPDKIMGQDIAGYSLSAENRNKIKINHTVSDIHVMIEKMIKEGRKFDAVDAGGILSYIMDDYNRITERVIKDLLKPGGVFIHDFQLMHWCMKRNAALFGWNKAKSNIHLLKDVREAENIVNNALKDMDNVEYEIDIDKSNEEPLAALITIKKVKE